MQSCANEPLLMTKSLILNNSDQGQIQHFEKAVGFSLLALILRGKWFEYEYQHLEASLLSH